MSEREPRYPLSRRTRLCEMPQSRARRRRRKPASAQSPLSNGLDRLRKIPRHGGGGGSWHGFRETDAIAVSETSAGYAVMRKIQQMFDDSGDAVFGIDRLRRIVYANAAFCQVLGREPGEIRGRPCYGVLCADDLSSRRFCNSRCPIAREALQNQPMQNFDLILTRSDGDRCWVNVGVYSAPEGTAGVGEPRVYFALRTVNGHRLIQKLASEMHKARTPAPSSALTPRETEILALTAHGQDTAGISHELAIAPQTVRNHFKNIFSKLDVRSRSQAVALALQRQLV